MFSGIEACSVAWEPLGWEPVAFAEIEPLSCAVLAHHYPDVPNLGSVTDITDEQIAALGPIDLVVGGSPCQDLSMAGKRKGLAGERSGLFVYQMRIFYAARRLCGARWLLWENVPGAFSVNKGRDFAVVVSEMAGAEFGVPRGGWQTAGCAVGSNGLCEWVCLDAQWYGVAQRRRRVFAVLDSGDWAGRPPLFSEQQSLSRDSAPSREAGESGAGTVEASTFGSSAGFECIRGGASYRDYSGSDRFNCIAFPAELSGTQTASTPNLCPALTVGHTIAVAIHENQRGELTTSNIVGALSAGGGKPGQGYAATLQGMTVRRLTPLECERLQGFPDNFTQIPYRNKPADKCPDRPRYKALGNSMAVPVMRWIGERIQTIDGLAKSEGKE